MEQQNDEQRPEQARRFERTCEVCGEVFLAKTTYKKLCYRPRCQVARWRQKQKQEIAAG